MPFRPTVNFQIPIGRMSFIFTEHPAARGMPYGQTGRRATVYQVLDENKVPYALKIFTNAFRSPRIAQAAERLKSFSGRPGLAVCEREVITADRYKALIEKYPDLQFAVLMPWMMGETWQEFMVSQRPLEYNSARTVCEQMSVLMVGMEQGGLAHCDIAGPNVLVDFSRLNGNASKVDAISLVDVEEMYGPGLEKPDKLPAGTPGYDHSVAKNGLWSLDADRFAGAVMLVEMLSRHDSNIRRVSFAEQFFDPAEMQKNTDRYQLVMSVLKNQGDSLAADLFARAWFSQTLSDCPTFTEWYMALNRSVSTSINSYAGTITSAPGAAGSPVMGWQAIGPGGRIPSNPPVASQPISNHPVSNPPVVIPLEQMKPMLLKAAEEGNWMVVLNIANQILQNYPADAETLNLQTRSQRLMQLEQAIQSLWQVANLSGTIEDWENCLRTIKTAQYQAPNLERYQQLRESAEKEHEIAARAQVFEKLLEDNLWDDAESLRSELPLDHPRIADLFARLDMTVGNLRRAEQLAEKARNAGKVRNWKDVVRLCRDGLSLVPDFSVLKDLLEVAIREQKLDADIADIVRDAQQAIHHGNWEEAEAKIKNALKLQPGRENLDELLQDVRQKLSWSKSLDKAIKGINNSSDADLLAEIEHIPDGFSNVDDIRSLLQKAAQWRSQIAQAQKDFDLEMLESLINAKPDSRIQAPEQEIWLKSEQANERLLSNYFKSYAVLDIEEFLKSLSEEHPLHVRCQNWLSDLQKRQTEISNFRDQFLPEQVLALLSEVGQDFPGYESQRQWAEQSLIEQKVLFEARQNRDLAGVERLLQSLPKTHPAYAGTQTWIAEEKNRKRALKKARAIYDVDGAETLLSGIAQDLPAYRDDWEWLQTQRSLLLEFESARNAFDVTQVKALVESLPKKHPYLPGIQEWLQNEINQRQLLQAAQEAYDLQSVRDLLIAWPEQHPLKKEGFKWLEDIEKKISGYKSASAQWDYALALSLLEGLGESYPDYISLREWAEQGVVRIQQAQQALDQRNADLLETLLGDWDESDPYLHQFAGSLLELRKQEQEITRLLARADEAIAAKNWTIALQASEQAVQIPGHPVRFVEIGEIAREKLEIAKKADELLQQAQSELSKYRYAAALSLAAQCVALDGENLAYHHAAVELRERLRKMARDFESKGQWEQSMHAWNALKQAPPLMPAPLADFASDAQKAGTKEPDTTPRESTDTLEKIRLEIQSGKVEQAAQLLQNADRKDYAIEVTANELIEEVRRQIQLAEKANQWERVKYLWSLVKKLQE
jgi:hypothetical protein